MSRVVLHLAAAAVSFLALDVAPAHAASTSTGDVAAEKRHLADLGCWRGPIDDTVDDHLLEARRTCPPERPILRVETEHHADRINGLSVDGLCRFGATASDDRTVRIWSMREGRVVETVRMAVGGESGGKVFSAALSPDGRWLAAGRLDGYDAVGGPRSTLHLYAVSPEGAATFVRAVEFDNRVFALAFDPAGERLAVGFKGPMGEGSSPKGAGVVVLETASGRELAADHDYMGDVYGVAFGRDRSLYAVSRDGFVRRYGPSLALARKVRAPHGQNPDSVSVSPTSGRVAIGYDQKATVSILSGRSLKTLAEANVRGLPRGTLSLVRWTAKGELLATGSATSKDGATTVIRRFDEAGRRIGRDLPVAPARVSGVAQCGDGLAFTTWAPSMGMVEPNGTMRPFQASPLVDMGGKARDGLLVSEDGRVVEFGLGRGRATPVRFDLKNGRLIDIGSEETLAMVSDDVHAPELAGFAIRGWNGSNTPQMGPQPLKLLPLELSLSMTVLPNRSGFVLGTTWRIRAFDDEGRPTWAVQAANRTVAVNTARDGELVVAAHSDGTIRWYDGADGRELLALFVSMPDRAWIAWMPSGHYMTSPGGERLVRWTINRGSKSAPDVLPADAFRPIYENPALVKQAVDPAARS